MCTSTRINHDLVQITNRFTDEIIFEFYCENNSLKKTLEEAVRQGVKIMYADFSHQDLRDANLEGAYLYANMMGTNLAGANLKNAHLCADLSGANLDSTNMVDCSFTGCNLSKARLMNSNLKGAVFSFSDLSFASFFQANLEDSGFFGNEINLTNFKKTLLDNEDYPLFILEQYSEREKASKFLRKETSPS